MEWTPSAARRHDRARGLQRDAAFHEMTLAQWNTRPAEEPCRQPLPSSHWRVPEHNVAAEKSMLPPTEERR